MKDNNTRNLITGNYRRLKTKYADVLNNFTKYLKNRQLSKDTIRMNCNYTACYLEWLEKEDIIETETTYNDLLSYIDYCGHEGDSKRLINIKLLSIRKYYNYLQYQGEAVNNPASGLYVKNKHITVPSNLLKSEELQQLYENYVVTDLRSQRNKVITGLLIYQGLTREELQKLELSHIKMEACKIEIPGGKHSNGRTLKLEAVQIKDLYEYLHVTRPRILREQGLYRSGRKPDFIDTEKLQNKLIISMNCSPDIRSSIMFLIRNLKQLNHKLTGTKQIRQSVISQWLKEKELRQVQYMAGHRYVSSTERYQQNNMEDLQKEIGKYHPLK
jgi:integrase/recombinase XerD